MKTKHFLLTLASLALVSAGCRGLPLWCRLPKTFLQDHLALVSAGCSSVPPRVGTMNHAAQAAMTPPHALQNLKDGNARFVAGTPANRNHLRQVRGTAPGQFPFATLVSCLDSRTSTELIFDQGIGAVFNARIAGNIVNPDILGSLEFAVKAAGSKLIAVIGHTHCGAIKGACDNVELGNLTGLLERIKPAVAATTSTGSEPRTSKNAAFVDRVAAMNVRQTLENIRTGSTILQQMEQDGQILIVGAMYDLGTGKVTFLD